MLRNILTLWRFGWEFRRNEYWIVIVIVISHWELLENLMNEMVIRVVWRVSPLWLTNLTCSITTASSRCLYQVWKTSYNAICGTSSGLADIALLRAWWAPYIACRRVRRKHRGLKVALCHVLPWLSHSSGVMFTHLRYSTRLLSSAAQDTDL